LSADRTEVSQRAAEKLVAAVENRTGLPQDEVKRFYSRLIDEIDSGPFKTSLVYKLKWFYKRLIKGHSGFGNLEYCVSVCGPFTQIENFERKFKAFLTALVIELQLDADGKYSFEKNRGEDSGMSARSWYCTKGNNH
jgi:hypothetical protein